MSELPWFAWLVIGILCAEPVLLILGVALHLLAFILSFVANVVILTLEALGVEGRI